MTVSRSLLAGAMALAFAVAASAPAVAARKHAAHSGIQLAKGTAKPHVRRAHVLDTVARRPAALTRHTGLVMTRDTASSVHRSAGPA